MTIAATLTSDLRSRAAFIPYCPSCSHVGVDGFADILRGPSHREVHLAKTSRREARTTHKLTACCMLSTTDEQFESEADAASWWRARRLQTLACRADDNRRRSTLAKLEAKGLEPITATAEPNL